MRKTEKNTAILQMKIFSEKVNLLSCLWVKKMKKNGVIRFIVTPYINEEATIESFEWGEQDATGDVYYTIQIKKYRRPTKKRGTKKAKKTVVTVKKGDTWAKLAKKYTGSSKNAKKIAKQNKMANKKKPPVGKKVTITP